MTEKTQDPNAGLEVGQELHGYQVEKRAVLADIDAVLFELSHLATGARHVHIQRQDAENSFGVAFKTVPSDSTGVAHILEHTVLCGSRKFPVRDPFFSMLKRSLSTFMNAFTASDWTMYPFCTQNRKDYYNLMDVYLDSCFFPDIAELSFKQEGHRLELEPVSDETGQPAADQLVYKGVVYNEMKGAMSAPDQVMGRSLLNALYPDTTYSNNSGGDPAVIPNLTWEQLKTFHQRHYHPSNAYFYTYGDLPLADHLAFIADKVLNHFDAIDPKTDVPSQPRWQAPQTVRYPYPLAKSEAPAQRCQVALAWLMADIQDTFDVLTLAVLEQVLLGNAASPLRKALMDANLGSALSDGTGFDADNRDTMFACGLKEVKESDGDRIEALILEVLRHLVEDGIDPQMTASAIHQIEFHRKEITNTPYPYGLKLLIGFAGSWLHGVDPQRLLDFENDLQRLKEALDQGPYLEEKLKAYLLDNTHRIRFTLYPDQEMQAREADRVRAELDTIQSQLSATDVARLKADAAALKQLQETTEDLSVLPTLALSDIPAEITTIEPTTADEGQPAVTYAQSTSGIFYFEGAISAAGLSEEVIPLVPFFCFALTKCGTKTRDYVTLARELDLYTGGVGASAHARARFDDEGACLPFVAFNGKSLTRNQDRLLDLIRELLLAVDFSNVERLRQLVLEYRAGLEAMVVHNGHRLAISLASRNFSETNALDEHWGGIHHLRSIKALSDTLDGTALSALADRLNNLAQQLCTRERFQLALVGEAAMLTAAEGPIRDLTTALPTGSPVSDAPLIQPTDDYPYEGWTTSTAVSFVAQTRPAVRMGHADAPGLAVLAKMLRSLYLHREIREKGGAYGGFALYNPQDGLFSLGSYRDPHVANTLAVYDGARAFVCDGTYTAEDIKEAILQVCSEIDKPDPPGPAARKAFYRRIIGLSDADRQAFKAGLLELDKYKVQRVARRYWAPENEAVAIAVISSAEKLAEVNPRLPRGPLTIRTI
ncbi:MAG: insulinase family protein [Desulfosarcinaceae bacterium]|nr:insulinase family protein [Desulfosarcinaceae bacterium]